MYGFWSAFEEQFSDMGGTLHKEQTVTEITRERGGFRVTTDHGRYYADQVVSAIPINLTKKIAPSIVGGHLDDHVEMLKKHEGSAIIVFLGVLESEVAGREITHHQILMDYDEPLGNGNNMFVSVSAPGDTTSAPEGYRAVMVSTHCGVEPWQGLDKETYERKKEGMKDRLIARARTVYPDLATNPAVVEIGTPATYAEFTNRPRGAIGGISTDVGKRQPTGRPSGYWRRRVLPCR